MKTVKKIQTTELNENDLAKVSRIFKDPENTGDFEYIVESIWHLYDKLIHPDSTHQIEALKNIQQIISNRLDNHAPMKRILPNICCDEWLNIHQGIKKAHFLDSFQKTVLELLLGFLLDDETTKYIGVLTSQLDHTGKVNKDFDLPVILFNRLSKIIHSKVMLIESAN